MPRPVGPVERVRDRFRAAVGPGLSERLPRGYQRLGDALLLRLPESLRPYFPLLATLYREETGAVRVIRVAGPVQGDWRLPSVEVLAGAPGPVEVRENGIRYRFDPARLMFAAGNRTERRRAGEVTRPGETVVDLFAGIGYLALPAAVHGSAGRVFACEQNPESFSFLKENARLNRVEDRLVPVPGDNRRAELPPGAADRVFLGLLPSSLSYLPRALALLRPSGGTLHVHLIAGTREPLDRVAATVGGALARAGGHVESSRPREVKPYGPGRRHVVVDLRARPARAAG